MSRENPPGVPPGRRPRGRALLLIGVVGLSALATYVITGWFRPAELPSVQRVAMELNVAVAGSDETTFLNRTVTEQRMVPAGRKDAPPAFMLYTDERGETVGFAAMEERAGAESQPAAAPPGSAAEKAARLIEVFVERYVGEVAFEAFTPAAVRTKATPPEALARSWRRNVRGLNLWVQDYGEYALDAEGVERLVRVRRYWVITVADWEIPRDVSAR